MDDAGLAAFAWLPLALRLISSASALITRLFVPYLLPPAALQATSSNFLDNPAPEFKLTDLPHCVLELTGLPQCVLIGPSTTEIKYLING